MAIRLSLLGVVLLAGALAAPVAAQELKTWKHGVIEPKGDAGFSLMVSRHGFAEQQGLQQVEDPPGQSAEDGTIFVEHRIVAVLE